jgi:hypothetical protein
MKYFEYFIVTLIVLFSYKKVKELIISHSFKKFSGIYPNEVLQNAERIYRLETNNFKSYSFGETHGAGVEAFSNNYPYGWNSIKKFWDKFPLYKPHKIIASKENIQKEIEGSGKIKRFIVFPSLEAGIATICEILISRQNDVGKFFSNDKTKQNLYRLKISKIKTLYV